MATAKKRTTRKATRKPARKSSSSASKAKELEKKIANLEARLAKLSSGSVSYTHLTLPTSDLV